MLPPWVPAVGRYHLRHPPGTTSPSPERRTMSQDTCETVSREIASAEGVGFEPTRKLAPPSDFQDLSCNLPDLHRCASPCQSGRVFGTTRRAPGHGLDRSGRRRADGYSLSCRTSADKTTVPDR